MGGYGRAGYAGRSFFPERCGRKIAIIDSPYQNVPLVAEKMPRANSRANGLPRRACNRSAGLWNYCNLPDPYRPHQLSA